MFKKLLFVWVFAVLALLVACALGEPDDTTRDVPKTNSEGDVVFRGETLRLPDYTPFVIRQTEPVDPEEGKETASDTDSSLFIDTPSSFAILAALSPPSSGGNFAVATVVMTFIQSNRAGDSTSLSGRQYKLSLDSDMTSALSEYNFALIIFSGDGSGDYIYNAEVYPVRESKIVASGKFSPKNYQQFPPSADMMYYFSNTFRDGMDVAGLLEVFDAIEGMFKSRVWNGTSSPMYTVTRIQ